MKTYVHFDLDGTIRSVVHFKAPAGAGMTLTNRAGSFVAELEGVRLKGDQSDVETVRDLARSHRISTPVSRVTLAKKSAR
ncbi:MAG TPA: hypothetical protein VKF32_05105 [Thermoanaerobaculia bacterium]|nr:hypothetical protein [Thermoanaerobaculia bacterium]